VRTTTDSFQAALAKGPLPRASHHGCRTLLIDEAATALRARARAAGYGEREVHFIERGFDWDALLMDANSLALFANLRLIELKLRNAPDASASKNLVKLAAAPPADTVLLVTGELEPRQQKSAWVNEFERQGTVVVAPPMTRERLPEWITRRLQQHGVALEPEAAQLLADRVEGNLLAAQQEIERIALLGRDRRLMPTRSRRWSPTMPATTCSSCPRPHSWVMRLARCASSTACAAKAANRR
jgi:DNA polymerase-3 subunit delta